jgi:hypothetical protein
MACHACEEQPESLGTPRAAAAAFCVCELWDIKSRSLESHFSRLAHLLFLQRTRTLHHSSPHQPISHSKTTTVSANPTIVSSTASVYKFSIDKIQRFLLTPKFVNRSSATRGPTTWHTIKEQYTGSDLGLLAIRRERNMARHCHAGVFGTVLISRAWAYSQLAGSLHTLAGLLSTGPY